MYRTKIEDLLRWKNKKIRKPLLVYGARQVGKTHLLKSFGETEFGKCLYFDLEQPPNLSAAFVESLSPGEIISNLEQLIGEKIDLKNTLIIFDEIQASNRCLASLKYFCEEMDDAYIVGAGSLLGVAVNRDGFSAPVGKVETMTLHPMSFKEFMIALGQEQMLDSVAEHYKSGQRYALHEQAMSYFYQYLLIGGMPEAVREFADETDYSLVGDVQRRILDLYVADMAKYATPLETARILEVWRSIPAQLAKENKKFQYKKVGRGGRASKYEASIFWLETAGLINRCFNINDCHLPLALHENRDAFKVYALDTGLLSSMMGVRAASILNSESRKSFDMGALVENYVAQVLREKGKPLHYWTSNGTAEIDFVSDLGLNSAVPIEVKSSENVRSRSLASYSDKFKPEVSIRISPKNFGEENGIKSVPLYATCFIDDFS